MKNNLSIVALSSRNVCCYSV